MELWDIGNKKRIKRFKGHSHYTLQGWFSPNGRQIISDSNHEYSIIFNEKRNDSVQFWDDVNVRKIRKIWHKKFTRFHFHCFSPDGRYIISGDLQGIIKLWDVESGKEIRSFEGHTDRVNSVCFSPDGRFLISGSSDKTIRLWDAFSGEQIRTFNGHDQEVESVRFAPDGTIILSTSSDNTIRFWEVASGEQIEIIRGSFKCFSSNGRFILFKGRNNQIYLQELDWELEFPDEVDWHENAELYVRNFLTLYDNQWTHEQFNQFYQKLQYAGLGWVRKEGVLKKMLEMVGEKH
jgi:WD40 repeat protein